MDICRLDSLDQARSLVDCAYDVYGLTFHRSWLYEAEGLLEVNRRGDVTSLLAIEDGRVVGHLGLMRPSWDVLHEGAPISDPGLREVGLSIVHPDFRSRGGAGPPGGRRPALPDCRGGPMAPSLSASPTTPAASGGRCVSAASPCR